MSSEWTENNLANLCSYISRGITPSYSESGVTVINQKCIKNSNVSFELARLTNPARKKIPREKYLQQYDILVNSTGVGTLGRVAQLKYCSNEITADSHITIVRANSHIDRKYLGYALLNLQRNIEALAQGSTGQTELPRDRLGNEIVIKYPISFKIQRTIVATLSCLDDKIELNNKINANLEAQAQAIFKSWFVDFEPFKDGEFVDSELGTIPEGWHARRVGDIAEKIAMGPFGSNIKVETFTDSGIPIISGNHLRGLYIDEKGYNFITDKHARRLRNSLVHSGDIIFTHAGNIGQVALIPEECQYSEYIISQRQFYLRCDKQMVLPEYMNYYFHGREGQGKLLANTSQTGVPSIARPSSHLKSIVVPVPPISVQLNWLGIVKPLLNSLIIRKKENRILASIRDTLLPKLMSGEIEVPVAESIIKERI